MLDSVTQILKVEFLLKELILRCENKTLKELDENIGN